MPLGPLKAMLDGEATAASLAAVRFAGGPLMFMALTLFVVRWNTLNGKAGAIGCAIAALNSAFIAFSMDGVSTQRLAIPSTARFPGTSLTYGLCSQYSFVPRPWYLLALLHCATACKHTNSHRRNLISQGCF